jgi:hypothetical protein
MTEQNNQNPPSDQQQPANPQTNPPSGSEAPAPKDNMIASDAPPPSDTAPELAAVGNRAVPPNAVLPNAVAPAIPETPEQVTPREAANAEPSIFTVNYPEGPRVMAKPDRANLVEGYNLGDKITLEQALLLVDDLERHTGVQWHLRRNDAAGRIAAFINGDKTPQDEHLERMELENRYNAKITADNNARLQAEYQARLDSVKAGAEPRPSSMPESDLTAEEPRAPLASMPPEIQNPEPTPQQPIPQQGA